MSRLSNIKETYGKQIGISIANTNGENVLASTLLPKNNIIIASPVNADANDIGTYAMFMTDGEGNDGSYSDMENAIKNAKNKIPVYSIMFGNASSRQLTNISDLTSGKVFDGRTNKIYSWCNKSLDQFKFENG